MRRGLIIMAAAMIGHAFPAGAQLWHQSGLQPGVTSGTGLTSNTINDILVLGSEVWVGTGKELLLTTNSGASWLRFTHEDGIGRGGISAVDPLRFRRSARIGPACLYTLLMDSIQCQTYGLAATE